MIVVYNYGMNKMGIMNIYFQWVPCHHAMACSQILDRGNRLRGQPTVGGVVHYGLDRS
jgi:hypothetical protein